MKAILIQIPSSNFVFFFPKLKFFSLHFYEIISFDTHSTASLPLLAILKKFKFFEKGPSFHSLVLKNYTPNVFNFSKKKWTQNKKKQKWMPSLRNCFHIGESDSINSPHASMQRWNPPSSESMSEYRIHLQFQKLKRDFLFRFSRCPIHCRFGYISASCSLNLSGDLQSWFQGLWMLFGKQNYLHFNWKPGVSYFPAFPWSYPDGFFWTFDRR